MRAALLRANARLLMEGAAVLSRVDPAVFAGGGARAGAAGAHLRHCLDFYDAFLGGVPARRIDYHARERDARTESDRGFALARIARTADALLALDPAALPPVLAVRVGGELEEEPRWAESSPERELEALFSHTIHHWALIATGLRGEGHEIPDAFGVAPSTLRARREAAARA